MKTKLLSALTLFTLAQIPVIVVAQCNPAIPNTANVVSFTQTVNGGFTPQWVCSGDTLFSGGGIFFVYLEAGAVMNTGGGIDTIYMKSGSVLDMNGGIHVIYFEPGAIINVSGGIPTYDTCVSVTFDYSNAPTIGCLITTAAEENEGSTSVSVYPNPAQSEIKIKSLHIGTKIETIEIFNTLGEKVYNNAGTSGSNADLPATAQGNQQWQAGTINVSKLSSGIYFVRVKTSDGMMAGKFVKE